MYEPAIEKQIEGYQYEDYSPREPNWYLDRTAHWIGKFEGRDATTDEVDSARD